MVLGGCLVTFSWFDADVEVQSRPLPSSDRQWMEVLKQAEAAVERNS